LVTDDIVTVLLEEVIANAE
jgi:hypothetical protein